MPFSLIGGLLGQSGDRAAGNQAFGNAQNQSAQNYSAESPYLDTGASGASLLSALNGTGYLKYYNGAYHGSQDNALGDMQSATNIFANSPFGKPVGTSFTASPSYNFRLSEGNKALDRSAASRGMLLSGAQTKALTDYNQNSASNEYQNWLSNYYGALGNFENSLGGQASRGASATGTEVNANTMGMNYANSMQNSDNIAGSNALANGIMSSGNNLLAAYLGGMFGGGYKGGTAAGLSSYGSASPTLPSDFGNGYYGVRGGV